jgi:hypothetical protein
VFCGKEAALKLEEAVMAKLSPFTVLVAAVIGTAGKRMADELKKFPAVEAHVTDPAEAFDPAGHDTHAAAPPRDTWF